MSRACVDGHPLAKGFRSRLATEAVFESIVGIFLRIRSIYNSGKRLAFVVLSRSYFAFWESLSSICSFLSQFFTTYHFQKNGY